MPSKPRDPTLLAWSRDLRKTMTDAERRLWFGYLRGHPARFRRQAVIPPYIADFYCPKAKLVIELDGSQHFEPDGQIYDATRTAYLEKQGISVLRFTNLDIQQRLQMVCETVEHALVSRSASKE